jgi:Zn-dependent protease with chaperone function
MSEPYPTEHPPTPDPNLLASKQERHQSLAIGALALPNLMLRSTLTLFLLYALLAAMLIAVVELGYLTPTLAFVLGGAFAVFQFTFGPWLLDLSLRWLYTMRWVRPDELPAHLRQFVERVCEEQRMKFPSFGVIDDGAPEAFTYGHHPGNARVVISRGLTELLEPAELEAVVAHELGHARNWDMALMTVANLVPLLLYFIYRAGIQFAEGKGDKAKAPAWAVALGAYVLYVVSEYMVLWFSRTREYYADRFAGEATGNPNALARALIKIAYGLAAQDSRRAQEAEAETDEEKKKARSAPAGTGALAALNIFDRGSAVNLVVSSVRQSESDTTISLERAKGAMQWDLWNPWARFYELHSTHPLVAKRLEYLADQAAAQGQEPAVVFDRAKPESYWDDFFADLFVLALPLLGLLGGLAAFLVTLLSGAPQFGWLGVALALFGAGTFLKLLGAYRGKVYPHLTVAALMGHVKVSPVRPVPATVTGRVIGKGVPGLVYSNDFVLRDPTGILFLNYQQPLGIWNFLFGLLRAGRYQGKEVRVTGWFRRAPMPYLEVYRMEAVDGSEPRRTCYSYHASVAVSVLLALLGAALAVGLFVAL